MAKIGQSLAICKFVFDHAILSSFHPPDHIISCQVIGGRDDHLVVHDGVDKYCNAVLGENLRNI